VHVVSRHQLSVFRPIVRDKPLLLVQHGVDENCFAPGGPRSAAGAGEFVVGVAGNANSPCAKGLDIVADACERADARYVSAVQDFDRGHLSKERMPAYYSGLDVYCVMSATEGLNNTILEAGAMGIPVVTTRAGAAPEIIEDGVNGILVERNRDALVDALKQLQGDPQWRRQLGARLRETVLANWTWGTRIEDFRNMFDRFFDGAARPRRRWLWR
jgi:glycosyltransferase involved in cell wall biosynthesis